MLMRYLSPEKALALIKGVNLPPIPPEITDLKKEIRASIRVGELRALVTGEIDQELVAKIVAMKLRLDELYGQWANSI